MFNTPILFLIFKRLETAKQVFAVLREIRPAFLYIAADGPRTTVTGESEQCKVVREYVLENIDWDCKVFTLFREKNLGCGKAVSEAISWFFDNVEQGIILEDDCLPSLSFFRFCEVLLEKYKENNEIYHIAGYNSLINTKLHDGASYFFTRIQDCWGWATWRKAWSKYNYDIKNLYDFISKNKIKKIFKRKCDQQFWIDIFTKMQNHEIDTWDYQWVYAILDNGGLCINPAKNLISNIGFGIDATHTMDESHSHNDQRFEIDVILHPSKIKVDNDLIVEINKRNHHIDNLWNKQLKKYIKFLRKIRFFRKIWHKIKKLIKV
jgi:hypothetical protein